MSLVQSLSHIWLLATPWTVARQVSLSITNSQSLLKLMSIKSVMQSNHLILCRPLLLLPSIFPSIRVFSSESVLRIKWSKYWSFNFSISPSSEYSGLISFRMDWLDLLAVQGTLKRDSQEGYLWLVSIIFTVRLVHKEDQKYSYGASLAVQWLRFHASRARGMGSILGGGTKIPHACVVWQKKKKPSYELDSLEGP